jgi:threonyl-tRNA synthetase
MVRFATRPAVRAGGDEVWDRAEAALADAARNAGLQCTEHAGEGAFYGPKLEFILRDSQAREWQCGTVQLDLVLPHRLDAEYVDAGSRRVRPVLIHHAILGSLERFIGILLEHHDGRLPFWLAPEQVVVAPVGETQIAYARGIVEALRDADLRARLDDRSETLSRRLVDAIESGVPVFAIAGNREARNGAVSIRRRGHEPVTLPVADAVAQLTRDAKARLTRGEGS